MREILGSEGYAYCLDYGGCFPGVYICQMDQIFILNGTLHCMSIRLQ